MRVEISNFRNIKSMTFEIPDGKVSLLTGASGSGKSSIATAVKGEFDADDVRAGADSSTMSVAKTPGDLTVKTFNVDTERRLYADELSSGIYDIVMMNDTEYEDAKIEFNNSVIRIRHYEEALLERRAKIKTLYDSTKTSFNKNGEFSKRSMIGSAKSALIDSPSQIVELIQKNGGKYLAWLISGVGFPLWHDEATCPFCLSNTVSQERVDYLNVVTNTKEVKGLDLIPTIESSLRNAGIAFSDLYSIEEFASIAQQVAALKDECQAIDAVLNFLNATSSDLRVDDNLLNLIDPNNAAYQQFPGLRSALNQAKGSSTRTRQALGKMRTAFRRVVKENQSKINRYLQLFDIPYRFSITGMSVETREANYYLVHNDASSEYDYRNKLSYGERNVIALILFLFLPKDDDDLIIIDDPVSSYDEYRREQIYRLIIEQKWDNTVLLLSHDHVFTKYALFHYKESLRQHKLNRSLSVFDERVLARTGDVFYLKNNNGTADTEKITVEDYDTMTNHILNRLSNSNLSYYQQVINLRLFYECERVEQGDRSIYSYLSAILHAPKESNFEECKKSILTLLSNCDLCEEDLLSDIRNRTQVNLQSIQQVSKCDFENRNDMVFFERIAAFREFEKRTEIKAEMSDLIHMNAALVYCLNPYKFCSCSRRLFEEITHYSLSPNA